MIEPVVIGDCTLYHADCLEVLPTLEAGSVDAVVTDPPYSSGARREGAKGLRKSMNRGTDDSAWFGSDCLTTNGFLWLMRAVAVESKRILCNGGHFLSFIDWRMSPALSGAVESADLRHLGMLVWNKTYFGMGAYFRNQHELIQHFSHGKTRPTFRHDVGNVLSFPPIRNGNHDTEKPVELLEAMITTVADWGEVIGDWFMGGGTTGVACVQTGRKFIGVEIDERYFDIACKRIEAAYTAQELFQQVTP